MSSANRLTLFHIDVARNSTDDFNLFHDPEKWSLIDHNPFQGPIALGFQLESLLEQRISQFRQQQQETRLLDNLGLSYSHYHFNFINPVKPGQHIGIEIKPSQFKSDPWPVLSNRVILKADGQLALTGYKKEAASPLFLEQTPPFDLNALINQPDRSYLADSEFFVKRKFMTTSNTKNLLSASLCRQSEYFDELENKVVFPEVFPCSYISCALLEKAAVNGHDFVNNPLVYTQHRLVIDRTVLATLHSNDVLNILARPAQETKHHDFGLAVTAPLTFLCYGVTQTSRLLFRALITLAPLPA